MEELEKKTDTPREIKLSQIQRGTDGQKSAQAQTDKAKQRERTGREQSAMEQLENEKQKTAEQEEEERRKRRKQRIEEMKKEKRRRELIYRYVVPAAAVVFLLFFAGIARGVVHSVKASGEKEAVSQSQESSTQDAAAGETGSAADNARESSTQDTTEEAGSAADNAKESSTRDAADNVKESSAQDAAAGETGSAAEDAQKGSTIAATDTSQESGSISEADFIGPMPQEEPVFEAHTTDATAGFSGTIISDYGILIDVDTKEVLAQKGGFDRINPASMTKILTVLVAAEHVKNLDDTFTMTIDITDYSYVHDCSNVGFEVGEVMTVRDLFYGTILQSGADAAVGLAVYVAGSQEAFVEMMNEKLEELGLAETSHFTNCVGLYDENHYSTPYDMAVMLKEAADNPFCREVLSAHKYVTSATEQHPEGIEISNWFLRRIEDRDTHGEVLCAKTGYVVQSRNCAASLAADGEGREYLCVTAGSNSVWTCIADQVELYQQYLPQTAAEKVTE